MPDRTHIGCPTDGNSFSDLIEDLFKTKNNQEAKSTEKKPEAEGVQQFPSY